MVTCTACSKQVNRFIFRYRGRALQPVIVCNVCFTEDIKKKEESLSKPLQKKAPKLGDPLSFEMSWRDMLIIEEGMKNMLLTKPINQSAKIGGPEVFYEHFKDTEARAVTNKVEKYCDEIRDALREKVTEHQDAVKADAEAEFHGCC